MGHNSGIISDGSQQKDHINGSNQMGHNKWIIHKGPNHSKWIKVIEYESWVTNNQTNEPTDNDVKGSGYPEYSYQYEMQMK